MPTTETVPTTLLQAVNILLRSVNIAQVSSLEAADTATEVQEALQHLSDTAVAVQTEGWHFNTEEGFPLQPQSGTGEILLPTNKVSFVPDPRWRNMDLTERGNRLYSKTAHTYDIGTTITGRMILLFPFEEIPMPIRWAIVARAGNEFGVSRAPDTSTYKFSKAAADKAWEIALDYDQEAQGRNLPDSSPHFAFMRQARRMGSGSVSSSVEGTIIAEED